MKLEKGGRRGRCRSSRRGCVHVEVDGRRERAGRAARCRGRGAPRAAPRSGAARCPPAPRPLPAGHAHTTHRAVPLRHRRRHHHVSDSFYFFLFYYYFFFYDKNRFSLGLLSFSPGVRPKVPRLFWQGGHIFCGAVPRNGHGRSGIVITDFLFRYAKCIEWKCSSWCQRSKRSQRGKDMVFRHKRGIYCTDDLL